MAKFRRFRRRDVQSFASSAASYRRVSFAETARSIVLLAFVSFRGVLRFAAQWATKLGEALGSAAGGDKHADPPTFGVPPTDGTLGVRPKRKRAKRRIPKHNQNANPFQNAAKSQTRQTLMRFPNQNQNAKRTCNQHADNANATNTLKTQMQTRRAVTLFSKRTQNAERTRSRKADAQDASANAPKLKF